MLAHLVKTLATATFLTYEHSTVITSIRLPYPVEFVLPGVHIDHKRSKIDGNWRTTLPGQGLLGSPTALMLGRM